MKYSKEEQKYTYLGLEINYDGVILKDIENLPFYSDFEELWLKFTDGITYSILKYIDLSIIDRLVYLHDWEKFYSTHESELKVIYEQFISNENNKPKREPNIYFCGDTHGYKLHTEKLISFLLYTNKQTTKDDFMIQLGDFGWIWKKLDDDQKQLDFLEWIASQNITFCVVLGNHENYDEIEKLPIVEKFGGKVRVLKLKTGEIYFFERGEVYDIACKKVFAFGGASSVDKEDRILGKTYWKQELPVIYEYSNALKNLKEHNFEVDMVVAHTCPSFLVRQMPDEVISIQKIEDPVAEFFDFIINIRNLKFKEWHFGHFHIDLKKELADFVFECHFRNIGQC